MDRVRVNIPWTRFEAPENNGMVPYHKNHTVEIMGKEGSRKGKKKRQREEKPALYTKDVGLEGIKRKTQTSISGGIAGNVPLTQKEAQRRKERQSRFGLPPTPNLMPPSGDHLDTALHSTRSTSATTVKTASSSSISTKKLVGENQNLEKPYLRLTTYPRARDVRPLAVLEKSLHHIKLRYRETEDFAWSNEQLKSVRQDITVQGIRNAFVLEVYETHARILLEHGDLNEFNQCQTMIRSLTEGTFLDDSLLTRNAEMNRKRKRKRCKPLKQSEKAADEFGAYAVLYALVQRSWMSLKMELVRVQPLLRHESSCNAACQHALTVVKAVSENNYHRFFIMYDHAPHMSAYLMDFLLKRVRVAAYKNIVAAFRPTVQLPLIQEWLGFLDEEEMHTFLKEQGACTVKETKSGKSLLDCKASLRVPT